MIKKELIRNFCIIAHIDHGKSTLADQLLLFTKSIDQRKFRSQMLDTMDIERERGITIKAQAVRIKYKYNDEEYVLTLIDTPGHVDFNYEVSRSLAACEGAILLVDGSQGIEAQTLTNFYLALDNNLKVIPVINKIDLPSSEIQMVSNQLLELGFEEEEIIKTSAKTGAGVEDLLKRVVEFLPHPEIETDSNDLRALLFDAVYDNYRGVIIYVKLVRGNLKIGQKIKLLASEAEYEALEIGFFGAGQFIKCDSLTAGEVGYIIAGIKSIRDVKIGDTITDYNNQNVKLLPGYKEVKPVVFSSLYPVDTADYDDLRDNLDKLKLNDNSFVFEPESSPALGFGFKCGFLGILHLEIIKERIERDYEIPLLVTTPSVKFKIIMTDGQLVDLTSPVNYPNPSKIKEIQEPFIKVNIIVHADFLGNVMQLCETYRGTFEKMEYLDTQKVILNYKLPLAEILVDFYDKLKSCTKGYASFDYEISDYEKSDLIKVDILINKEPVDALSMIIHKEKAYTKGKNIVEKLKELIPRQQFAVPIQAAIGSKVISRSTIKALRKDVLAKLYGGDITRKQKVLKKQKLGKKKLKTVGKVSVPNEVFSSVLKI